MPAPVTTIPILSIADCADCVSGNSIVRFTALECLSGLLTEPQHGGGPGLMTVTDSCNTQGSQSGMGRTFGRTLDIHRQRGSVTNCANMFFVVQKRHKQAGGTGIGIYICPLENPFDQGISIGLC